MPLCSVLCAGGQPQPSLTDPSKLDRPLTDLYDTEGEGGFPGLAFMARPVVGGNFAFLALERACGGKAVEALQFLDNALPSEIDVQAALLADKPVSWLGDEVTDDL